MLDEIHEQPTVLERILAGEVRRTERFKAYLAKHRPRLIVLAARGTSDNAALFGRYLFEITTGIPVSLAAPSVCTLYGARVNFRDALVVGISQSGESTDINVFLEQARSEGALTVAITNQQRSTMAGIAEHVFPVGAKRERSVAATKTYTGQLLMLYLLAWALGGKIQPAHLHRLPELVNVALRLEPAVRELSGRYRYMHHAIVVGRGLSYANAFEFSLKLMETCYVVAERFSSADFLHGPIALVEPGFPVFAFAPAGVTWSSVGRAIGELHNLGAEIVAITDAGNRDVSRKQAHIIRLPRRIKEILAPIPYIVPAQLFAAHLAQQKGLDPDRPRGLSKVTRTL